MHVCRCVHKPVEMCTCICETCVVGAVYVCVCFLSYTGVGSLDEIVSLHHCFLETTESKQGRKGNSRHLQTYQIMKERLFFLEPLFISCVALGKLPRLSEPLFSSVKCDKHTDHPG